MATAPIATPEVLWRAPPVLALAAVRGAPLGRLGEPSTAPPGAWAAAGAAVRTLHDAPLPPWPGRCRDDIASELDRECGWLVTNGVLLADLVACNRRVAEAALRLWKPVFTHGDLQISHEAPRGAVVEIHDLMQRVSIQAVSQPATDRRGRSSGIAHQPGDLAGGHDESLAAPDWMEDADAD